MDFRVLGPLQVADGARTVGLGGPMQRAVLALLVLDPNRVVSVERLIDGLWDDDPPARATGTVQAYVSNLRRVLEPERRPGEPPRVLASRAPGYVLQVDADDVDWVRFERLFHRARQARGTGDLSTADAMLVEARALWRGPPLADLGDIARPERVWLDGLRLGAVEEHAEVLLALGRHHEALDDLVAVAAEYPLRERLRGLQMTALYRAGRQVEALEVYTEVRQQLAEEHGLDPGADLRALHERVLRQDPELAPVRPAPSPAALRLPGAPAPLVGRAAELATLRAHLGATQAGSGRVVLVEGEPGVGKTRLAEEAATEASARGFVTLWGRCVEGEGSPPLWPWAQVLRAIGDDRTPAELVPQSAQLDPGLALGQLNQGLADLLRGRARTRPLLLVLDDLQWADEATLPPLEFLAAHLGDARILVLAIYREVDLPQAPRLASVLGVLARLPGADRVALRGLNVDEVAGLIRARTGAEPAPDIATVVHRRTEGNPFFVTELLCLEDPEGPVQGPVPTGVRDVIRRRVARLPHDARTLLDTAALVGRDVDPRRVGGLCGLDGGAALEAAEAAYVNGLLADAPDKPGGYRFTHALVQETLVGDLAPTHRAHLHERVGLALVDAYGEDDQHAGEVAEHLWASLPAGDLERVLRAQAHAAEVAWAGLAHEHAETLLERASALLQTLPPTDSPPEVDLAIHIRLGSLLSTRHGHPPEARKAFDRARALANRLDRSDAVLSALWGMSATAVIRGDLAAAEELIDTALEQARHSADPSALARGHQGVGIVAFYRGHLSRARQHFADALSAWDDTAASADARYGLPAHTQPDVMAPSYDALAADLTGHPAAAQQQITRALRAAAVAEEPYALAFVHSFHARLAVLQRDRHTAQAAATQAIDIAEQHGFRLLAGHAAIPLGWARADQGEPEVGLADIERGLAALHHSGQRILTPFHRGLQAEVSLTLGESETALTLLDDALAESAARGGGFETPGLLYLRGRVLDALGRGEQAQVALQGATEAAGQQGATPRRW